METWRAPAKGPAYFYAVARAGARHSHYLATPEYIR